MLFILQEFLFSHELLQQSEKLSPKEYAEISAKLEQLLRFSLDRPSDQRGGTLDKLCYYCEILLQASKVGDEKILIILEEMRNEILEIKSKFLPWKKKLLLREEMISSVTTLFFELRQKLSSFFSTLNPFFEESRADENILFYLIEHREKFNRFLGARTIENLLNKLFPNGLCELHALLREGYTRRGFALFFAEQEPLLNAIEWESNVACHFQSTKR